MENAKNNSVFSNLIWKLAERYGAQIVQFVVSIVLARILVPEVYGTVALVTVIITILQVFIDSGFGSALIQKKDADDLDFSTVFFFNIFFCLLLYFLVFLFAPLIAKFYENPDLTSVIRVLSITIIFSSFSNVQYAYISKNMQFKKFFLSTTIGIVASAVVGIVLAKNNFGIWAIVWQNLTNVGLNTIVLWLTVKWKPKMQFSFKRLKSLFSFGWKLLASALLDTVYNNSRQLVIGKKYSNEDLAFYNKGNQFPNLIVTNINNSIDSVIFPVMAKEQDNIERIKFMTKKAIKTSTYIMAPMMIGLAVLAESVIRLVLTDKWLECAFFMQIFCIDYMFYPIHTANLNALKAMGRSDLFLKLEVIKKVVGISVLLVAMWFGVKAIALSLLISVFASTIINSWPNWKLLGYSYLEQMKDVFSNVILAVIMGVIVWLVGLININYIVLMFIQMAVGALTYLILSILLKNETFFFLFNTIKDFLKKKFSKKTHEQIENNGESNNV